MRIVIAGGTGQLGAVLVRHWRDHDVTVLARGTDVPAGATRVAWDGRTVGAWADALDGADVVVNLAGRSVNCRYTPANLTAMMTSRVDSTRAIGAAIGAVRQPPRVWLQMSTATIYAHRFDAANDEATGIIGGAEPGVPTYWRRSIEIAQAWEATQAAAITPTTRQVTLRTAMVMSADPGGVFDVLLRLVRLRLGGAIAGGRQYVSWIHADDFARALDLLIARDDLAGPINLCAPEPVPQRAFMAALRRAWGTRIGLPATGWMAEIGAWLLRTDTELVRKSRRVVPGRLRDAGFEFAHPTWAAAAKALVATRRA